MICLRDRFKDGTRNVSHSIVLKLHITTVGDRTGRAQYDIAFAYILCDTHK